jgi:ferritin-like metal-binding protein YciE
MAGTIHDQVTSYLTDAHAIEEQALAQLRSAPKIVGSAKFADALRLHLDETEGHERVVRGMLETRNASPSWFKDVVMKLGGKGFILFARVNPDTSGKLLTHTLSYEALEEAAYALLGIVALKAGENDVADRAATIEADEIAMQARLSACFEEVVSATLAEAGALDLRTQLRTYLADAHAIEMQAITLLERAAVPESGALAEAYRHHLVETQDQAEAIAERLRALGGDRSTLKDAALRLGGINASAFFEAHPDTPGKLAAFVYAFEHLEIGAYEQLARVADRAGDDATVRLVDRILEQERSAAMTIRGLFPVAAELALAAIGVPR